MQRMQNEKPVLECSVHPCATFKEYKYVAIVSFYKDGILLSRKRGFTTWETQGGHIEAGETPEQAARRELYEESGALEYTLEALADYSAAGTHGVAFAAHIITLGALPESEMEEVCCFKNLPDALTYPGITPKLFTAYNKSKEGTV